MQIKFFLQNNFYYRQWIPTLCFGLLSISRDDAKENADTGTSTGTVT